MQYIVEVPEERLPELAAAISGINPQALPPIPVSRNADGLTSNMEYVEDYYRSELQDELQDELQEEAGEEEEGKPPGGPDWDQLSEQARMGIGAILAGCPEWHFPNNHRLDASEITQEIRQLLQEDALQEEAQRQAGENIARPVRFNVLGVSGRINPLDRNMSNADWTSALEQYGTNIGDYLDEERLASLETSTGLLEFHFHLTTLDDQVSATGSANFPESPGKIPFWAELTLQAEDEDTQDLLARMLRGQE